MARKQMKRSEKYVYLVLEDTDCGYFQTVFEKASDADNFFRELVKRASGWDDEKIEQCLVAGSAEVDECYFQITARPVIIAYE